MYEFYGESTTSRSEKAFEASDVIDKPGAGERRMEREREKERERMRDIPETRHADRPQDETDSVPIFPDRT